MYITQARETTTATSTVCTSNMVSNSSGRCHKKLHAHIGILKYLQGPIVRHGPHRLSFNTPGAVRDIYGGYGSKVNIIKDPYYTVTEKKVEKLNVVAVVDPVQHSRKRRNMAPAFTTSAVKAMEAGIIKNLNLYCDAIGATEETAKAASTDLAQLTAYFAFDAMTSNVFSRGFNILSSAANRWIPKTLANAVTFTHVVGFFIRFEARSII